MRWVVIALLFVALASVAAPWPTGKWPLGISSVTGMGDESTLAALLAMNIVPMYGTGNTYYVSCDAGGDYPLGGIAETGLSPDHAKLNWADTQPLMETPGVNVIFDAGDNCFVFPAASDVDYSIPTAPGSRDVVLRISSSQIGTRVVITQTGAPTTAFMHMSGAVDDFSTIGGAVVLQDLDFESYTRPPVICDDGIYCILLNVKGVAANGADSTHEELGRGLMDSQFVCIKCDITSVDDSAIYEFQGGSATYIGTATFTKSAPGVSTAPLVYVQGGESGLGHAGAQSSVTIIGHKLVITGAGASFGVIQMSPVADYGSRVALARVVVTGTTFGTGSCLRFRERSDEKNEFFIYQSTLFDCDQVLYGNNQAYVAAIPPSTKQIMWSILDGGTGMTNMFYTDYGGSIEDGIWDFRSNILNERGGALTNYTRYRRPDTTLNGAATTALWRTDIEGEPLATQDGFSHAFLPSENTISAVQQVDVNYACVAGQPCASISPTRFYTVPLYGHIWKEVLGANDDITALRLSASYYGAVPTP